MAAKKKSRSAKVVKAKEVAKVGNIFVHTPQECPIHLLEYAGYNPRKISPRQFDALKSSIRKYGFLDPLIVQKSSMMIIGVHQRVRAIKEICVEDGTTVPEIPCVLLEISDYDAKLLNIKLNKISGEFEAQKLGELLIDMNEQHPFNDADYFDMGFEDRDEPFKFMGMIDPTLIPDTKTDELSSFGRSITLSIEFETVETRDAVKQALKKQSEHAKKKTGDIIADKLNIKGRKSTKRRAA